MWNTSHGGDNPVGTNSFINKSTAFNVLGYSNLVLVEEGGGGWGCSVCSIGAANPVYCTHDSVVLQSRLGDVVISVLATGSKGLGSKPGRGDEFLMAVKIRSSPFFGWELKPEAPCRTILRHVKEPYVAWLRCYVRKIQRHFSAPSWVIARRLWCSQRALVDESGVLELRWGRTIGQEMAAVLGKLRSTPPSTSNQ
jgi:hypothetical protein